MVVATPGSGETAPLPFGPLPLLGVGDSGMTLMGAAPAGEPGEAWGYRRLPLAVGSVRVGTRDLGFGPAAGPAPDPQLAFLRHTDASGWQVFDMPVDGGLPYRGPVPNRLSARITPEGGGVLVGRDTSRPVDEQLVVLIHDPGEAGGCSPHRRPRCFSPPVGEIRPRLLAKISAPVRSRSPPSTSLPTPGCSSARKGGRWPTGSSTTTGLPGHASRSASAPLPPLASPPRPTSASSRSTPPGSATSGRSRRRTRP